eukprot:GSMAST32.ASY1.ANO1.677.1 assembled CDS
MNLYELVSHQGDGSPGYSPPVYVANHLLSATLISPFIAVTAGIIFPKYILRYNWFPASVFVGDTFCYFAGMTFAVTGIMGHFSKTLLLFLIPQLLNFVISIPQLIPNWVPGAIPNPRHRLPIFNVKTGLRGPSYVHSHHTFHIYFYLKKKKILFCVFGPMKEESLCFLLLFIQCMFYFFFLQKNSNLFFIRNFFFFFFFEIFFQNTWTFGIIALSLRYSIVSMKE